jgi:hypothetical protein
MFRRMLVAGGAAFVLLIGTRAHAQHFEIDVNMYRGDPKGSREAGTLIVTAAPQLAMKSGERGSVLVGGSVPVRNPDGITFEPIGRQVEVAVNSVDAGGIKVVALFEHREVAGKGPQIARSEAATTATIQSGGSIRLELCKNTKDREWVVITIRKLK